MWCETKSAALTGVQSVLVRVEVDVAGGLPSFVTVGLAEGAVREARVRVQSALANSGVALPAGRITVNLAPADLRKGGTGFDLPIAVALAGAAGAIDGDDLSELVCIGELSLAGELRGVPGVLAAAEAAKRGGATAIWVAPENADEAALVEGLDVYAPETLTDLLAHHRGTVRCTRHKRRPVPSAEHGAPDLRDVHGQAAGRRALEIAAAGGHNLIMVGGPGAGKTMLARRLPGILPTLSVEAGLEVARVASAAGLAVQGALPHLPPFRAPHHTATPAGLAGGGSGAPRPGEVSLAHRGVLFLDELPEFSRAALEVLRQPLEAGTVVLSRAGRTVEFPADIALVAAMNPCPCGHAFSKVTQCRCSPRAKTRYHGRISGPLLDRMDLQVELPRVPLADVTRGEPGESSAVVRARVDAAVARQRARGQDVSNARLDGVGLDTHAELGSKEQAVLIQAGERLGMSARGLVRAQRVARTIADLAGQGTITAGHVFEALQYQGLERRLAAA